MNQNVQVEYVENQSGKDSSSSYDSLTSSYKSSMMSQDQDNLQDAQNFCQISQTSSKEGSEIAISPAVKLERSCSNNSMMLENISREDIRLVYTFTKILGQGSYGTVRIAYKTVNPGQMFAVKSIKRASIKGSEEELRQELGILLAVDHPNIVKLHEIYLDQKYIHLVTELLEGGEISPDNTEEKRFSENQAAKIVRQSLQALNYLHELKIVHCDLKTENMLFAKNRKFVKLIDFGFANFCRNEEEEEG